HPSRLHYSQPLTSVLLFSLQSSLPPPHLHSFPTRRSSDLLRPLIPRHRPAAGRARVVAQCAGRAHPRRDRPRLDARDHPSLRARSEEHTSELQSLAYLVCRLLLEKKNIVDATVTRAASVVA